MGVSFQQLQKYKTGYNRINASGLFIVVLVLGEQAEWFFEGLLRTPVTATPSIESCDTVELKKVT